MSELVFLSSGVQMEKGNKLLHRYFANKALGQKKILLIGDREPEWFALCRDAFVELGFVSQNIFTSQHFDRTSATTNIDYLYMAEGNTFQQLHFLKTEGWIPFIMNAWESGTAYIGVSAGVHIACKSISPAVDFDDVEMYHTSDFRGLGLFDGVVIPHFSEDSRIRVEAKNKAIELFSKNRVLSLCNSQMAVINALNITIIDLERI